VLIIKLEETVDLLGEGVEINFTSQVEKEDGLLLRYASRRQKMEIFLYYTEY
jgi:hypothetical protein